MDLGKFEVIEELGKGGFGIVYLALDKVLDRQVALKVLHPQLLVNPNFILRFKQEAQLSARLDHPNLLPVYDFGEFEGRYYIVMAYMPDGSLKDLLRKEGKLDKQRSLKIFEQICDGMSYAHSQKIIHRDLKPGNILFDSHGNARISDMGFAKLIHSDSSASMSSSGRMVGTPSYMAPEIWQGKPATSATDVYSLACVLVEMLTGQTLFAGETTPEIMMKHFAPLNLPEDLPEEWKPVLEATLEKQPEKRVQTVGEFIEQIKAVELGLKKAERVEPEKSDKSKAKKEKQTPGKSESEQSTEIGEGNPNGAEDTQETKHSKSGFSEDPYKEKKKSVLVESKERKGKPGLKAAVITGIALLAIILGVIIYQIVKRNSPSTAPVIAEVPVTLTATNTAVKPTKTATPSPTATETPAPTATEAVLGIGSTRIRSMDGMEQVYVPAGNFIMGSDDSDADSNEKPVRTVYLDAYWIDKYEVSNGQYLECVAEGSCISPHKSRLWNQDNYYGYSAYDNYPVIFVDWNQAKAYCEWAGGALPTEAQWEKAARGTDGRKYPWGNEEPDHSYANYYDYDDNGDTTEVGSYEKGASPYGAMDMAGNVEEWVNDWYAEEYDANDINNPQGPSGTSQFRVFRGGSWDNSRSFIRAASRVRGNLNIWNYHNIGFRCVSSTATDAPTETPAATTTDAVLGIGSMRMRPMDEMEQVYVPAGNFIMGSDDNDSNSDEKPEKIVYLDDYWIDKYEVSNGQYQKCVTGGGCTIPRESDSYTRSSYYGNPTYDDYPVINVNWYQAKNYCEWAGGDLPSEAQWEKAARGDNGRKYPWGDSEPDSNKAHYGFSWGNGDTTEVGSKPAGASPYGALNMADNVSEWANYWYTYNYVLMDTNNPQGPYSGRYRVIRGGGCFSDDKGLRVARRWFVGPDTSVVATGFRCVSSP